MLRILLLLLLSLTTPVFAGPDQDECEPEYIGKCADSCPDLGTLAELCAAACAGQPCVLPEPEPSDEVIRRRITKCELKADGREHFRFRGKGNRAPTGCEAP